MKANALPSFEDTSIAFSYKSDYELKKMHFIFWSVKNPFWAKLATNFVKISFKIGLPIKWLIRPTVYDHFCGGETIQECRETIDKLSNYGVGTILDYSVEGLDTEKGFELTKKEIIQTVRNSKGNPDIPFCVFKATGIGPADLMEKVQANVELSWGEQQVFENFKARVKEICEQCHQSGVRLFVDAEESWMQDVIDDLVEDMMHKYNRREALIYNTYQMYRKDMLINLKSAFEKAKKGGYLMGAKLVRGAYMEKERDRAEDQGYPDPIHESKSDTDNSFNSGLVFCLENVDRIAFCCGSHNEYSNKYLAKRLDEKELSRTDKRIYFAQLFGMSDHISFNLAHAGFNVAKYLPYGPVKSVLPYLLRRAEENTAVMGQSTRELNLVKKEIARRKSA